MKILRKNIKEKQGVKHMKKIAGYEKEKKEILELQSFLLNIDKYKELGIRIPRGLILEGVPGVGKTKLAKAIVCDGIELVEVRAADCCDDNAAELIQDAFEEAKQKTPAVVLLDEIDKLAGTSHNFFMEDNDNIRKILLQELDGLSENDGILVVATCNDIDCIGDALMRSGRFDRRIYVPKPDEADREKILSNYFAKVKLDRTFEISEVAQITAGYTGAELECLVNESAIMAVNENESSITMDIVRRVINKIAFKSIENGSLEDDLEKRSVAIHEAGHVLVALLTMKDRIYGASILPQGNSLGHVHMLDGGGKIVTVNEKKQMLAVQLAGQIAEREVLGDISLGSEEDLRHATFLAKMLVTRHAAYGYEFAACSINPIGPSVSESMMHDVERKIADIFSETDQWITNALKTHSALFDKIVSALINKTVLNRDELLKLYEIYKKEIA